LIIKQKKSKEIKRNTFYFPIQKVINTVNQLVKLKGYK